MNTQGIALIYDYNYWANGRILAAAAGVSAEQFTAPGAYGLPSLRGILAHLLDAEYSWRMLCQQNLLTFNTPETEFPTLEALAQRWREEEIAMRAYLAGLNDCDLTGLVRYTVEGRKRERVLWHCLLHVANHGTQHRAEAAALLTGYGRSPGDVDFTAFLNEKAQA